MDINSIRFTDKVREIFSAADQKAKQCKHQYIDCGHMLSAILDTECLGKKLLESTNHDLNHLRKSFANNLDSLPTIENLNSKTEITTDLFNVIKKSENEAKVLGDTYLASDLITFYILSDENLQFTQDDKLDLSSL